MSDDLDFDMEVVGDDELEEMSADGESSLGETSRPGREGTEAAATGPKSGTSKADESASNSTKESSPTINPDVVGWQRINLGELASFQNGNAFSKSDWGEEGYPIIRIQNLTGEADEYNYYKGELESRYRVEPGDTLLTWSGTIGAFNWNGPPAALNQHIFKVETGREVNDSFFQFKLEELIPQLEALSHGSTMKHVRKADLVNIDVEVPPLPEQRKIASVLYAVDQAIQKTEEIIEQAKRVKRGLMQDVFRLGIDERWSVRDPDTDSKRWQRTPLGKIPNSWECVRLGNVVERSGGLIQTGPFGSQLHQEEYVSEGVPVVMPQNIEDGRVDTSEIAHITKSKADELDRHRLQENDVVLARRGKLDRAAVITKKEEGWICGTGCLLIRLPVDEVDGDWFGAAYGYSIVQDQIKAQAVGSTMLNLNQSILENLQLALPPLQEQERIASVLSRADEKIKKEGDAIAELRRFKKGLMQDLLTGEVRTADRAIEVLDEVQAHG